MNQKRIIKLINWAKNYLAKKGFIDSREVAESIAEYILGKRKIDLYLEPDLSIEKEKEELFKRYVRCYARGVPLAYIIGEQYFLGEKFLIRPGVFIPRPETELLVEKAVEFLNKRENHPHPLKVVDLGTGSGNIAVSIAKRIENVIIYATDISSLALKVAKENASLHRVEKKIVFVMGDLFSPLENYHLEGKIDLIVSNPPYVEKGAFKSLPSQVKKEPRFALEAGEDGLFFHRKIILSSPRWLSPGGALILEVGYNQAEKVEKIACEIEDYRKSLKIFKDLSGIPRIIKMKKILQN
ncbi:peptide chain release factor N(5)-glutamine methyltransferase [Candidatus Aerophobetes bacterium]|nr:peptide chain release factor N(5)-glutamine methyltransferase [Candidatus Aerophobetes bacterium]